MRTYTLRISDVDTCPVSSLDPAHYDHDGPHPGRCGCTANTIVNDVPQGYRLASVQEVTEWQANKRHHRDMVYVRPSDSYAIRMTCPGRLAALYYNGDGYGTFANWDEARAEARRVGMRYYDVPPVPGIIPNNGNPDD